MRKKAQELLDAGNPPAYVSRVTGIPIDEVCMMVPNNPKMEKALSILSKTKGSLSLRDSKGVSEALGEGDIELALKEGSPGILLSLYDLAQNSEDERIRLNASNSWLDRAGYKPVDRVDIHAHVDNMTKEEAISNVVGLLKGLPKDQVSDIIDGEWEDE